MKGDVSADFARPARIYLNSAAVSPMPLRSIGAVRGFLEEYCSLGPDSAEAGELVEARMRGAREAVSRLISCGPDEVVLTQSTTDGVNMVAGGLRPGAGANAVIRGMGHEHHSNLYPWLRLGAQVRSMPVDGDGFFAMADLESRVDGRTAIVALSHALYNTGALLPVAEAGRAIGGRAPYFVDAAQTAGCAPVDVREIGCDFMSFNGSKWLCGPIGTGAFYCRRGSAGLLEPASVGGESASLEGGRLEHRGMPDRFQAGFRNYAGVAGLEASAGYMLGLGIGNVRAHCMRLAGILRDEISRIPGSALYGPEDPGRRTSIVPFNVAAAGPDEAAERLRGAGIVLAVREMGGARMLRASPHVFNTEDDVARAADALRAL